METYKVLATRSDGWWAIEVPTLDGVFSQGRDLHEVGTMAREAIAMVRDVPEDRVAVAVFVDAAYVAALQAHAEALADSLEDVCFCVQDEAVVERARQVWQAYVGWNDALAGE